MLATATLGYPRIGPRRELKRALEDHWSGRSGGSELAAAAARIKSQRWREQRRRGIAIVPSNDFSLYDHVLDTAWMLGALPARARDLPRDLGTYFKLARGGGHGGGCAALEMTKWFDTNYHYLVPELDADTAFAPDPAKPVGEFREALAMGIHTRPVLLGPVSFLRLAKRADGGDPLELLPRALPAYAAILAALAEAGADWIQLDEPCLVTDLAASASSAFAPAYAALSAADPRLRLLVATYHGALEGNLAIVGALPIHGLHLDLVRGAGQLEAALAAIAPDWTLSLGVVDGRSPWRADLPRALALIRQAAEGRPAGALHIAPSCSLMHLPVDLAAETALDPRIARWLAFADEKLDEVAAIAALASAPPDPAHALLQASRALARERASSPLAVDAAVRARAAGVGAQQLERATPLARREELQREALRLPAFPTTSIGSFPQTPEVRAERARFRSGAISAAAYGDYLRAEIARCVRAQEEAGLDVLVHGEFERTDMVEHFAELLGGFAVTANGWVQSYGSRCVKPPIIVGDVKRPRPMTVDWAVHAQSLTRRPMKGMLTGPVTMLQWSFVRDDLTREQVCRQIALALREEVADLERAGIRIIQVDEPALREGLPLRRRDQPGYLRWAVECFRLATAGAAGATQIHTHMCYSEFNDIMPAIAALDADVVSIETARSRMELLGAFADHRWSGGIGPGVYDIHSPSVPRAAAMADLLRIACRHLRPEQLWVNPDCGLKTRGWPEVEAALARMVEAARALRAAQPTSARSGQRTPR